VSEERGEGLRKRDTGSSKLEERGRERELESKIERFRFSRSGLADWPAATLTRITRGGVFPSRR
jgi:hypothetical protein